MSKFNTFKEGVKLVALLQASLEQMDELKGTSLHRQKVKQLMAQLERELEKVLKGPLASLDKEDPELLTRIQSNVELVLGMDLEELAMLRQEVDEYRAGKDTLEKIEKCKHIKREGESCRLNNNCTYPDCTH
jgi:uncharacterized protein YbgA (DUF1722 family)